MNYLITVKIKKTRIQTGKNEHRSLSILALYKPANNPVYFGNVRIFAAEFVDFVVKFMSNLLLSGLTPLASAFNLADPLVFNMLVAMATGLTLTGLADATFGFIDGFVETPLTPTLLRAVDALVVLVCGLVTLEMRR